MKARDASRHFSGGKLIIASHNPGKVREIGDLLAPFRVEAISAGALGLPEPEETGTTFRANAELKAHASAQGASLPALADDSGMAVDALDGAPGIYSARWAGPTKDFNLAMERVWREVMAKSTGSKPRTRAHFICALSLAWPDGHVETFEGVISGHLVWPPRGSKGFGYDPMFRPDAPQRRFLGFTLPGKPSQLTFGEMEPEAKHAISHRALAFRQLIEACFAG